MAWLLAIPRIKSLRGPEIKQPARIEAFKAGGAEPPLPPIEHREHFDWMMEIGPTEPAGMSRSPISWASIDAWARATATRLLPWEVRLVRRLSRDFLAELEAAEDANRPAPWSAQPSQVDREANERQLRAVLG